MSKFICDSSELYKKLLSIKDAVPSNPVIPILENFLFEIESGELTMTASTMQISLQATLDVQSEGDIKAAVPAKMLLNTLKELPNQPITIELDEPEMVFIIQASTGSYKMSYENAEDYPKQGSVDSGNTYYFGSGLFQKALNATLKYASNDDLKPAMQGIYILEDAKRLNTSFVATDSHRLTEFKAPSNSEAEINDDTFKVLIPAKALDFIKSKLTDEDVELTYDKNKAVINTGDVVMTARLIDERFPDYENVIPEKHDRSLTVSKNELMQSIKRVMIYANQSTRQVKIECAASSITISAEDADFNNRAQEVVHAVYEANDNDSFAIGFNGNYLVEGLSAMPSDQVEILMTEANRAAIIKPVADTIHEDYEHLSVQIQHLIMPLMLNNYY